MSLSPSDLSQVAGRIPQPVHIVKFYDSEDGLFAIAGEFLAEGLLAGEPLVVIARGVRHDGFAAALRDRGLDDDTLAGRLRFFDAHEMLERFMSGTLPDESRFMQTIGGLVASTIEQHGTVRAYGEMVDILWRGGNPEGAIRLEELWNELAKQHSFSLFCAYPIGSFSKETHRSTFDAICEQHTNVIPAEESVDGDSTRTIALLQQRALALETEIRQRKELERALCESLSARRAAEEELRKMVFVAQDANRAKDQFLATLSHELRTPLTAILGWARMLTLGGLDADTTRLALDTIERSARIQATIVDDLLDLSRIVTGKVVLNRDLVDIRSTVDEAIQTCQLAAEAKNIRVSVTHEQDRAVVMGDSTRLRQVVWNLFSNAVKYSNAGSDISVTTTRNDFEATIVVRDNGRGISPQFLAHVFEPFRQADSSSTRGHGGLGLGLTIVKHLTELHGGRVEAKSDGEGRGATFIVRLPLVKLEPKESDAVEDQAIDLQETRILVVDDDASSCELLAAVLRRFGAEVEIASTTSAALTALRDASVDAIVTDIAIPDEDGFALLAQIRALAGRRTPVIAVTALSELGSERIARTGFDAYLRKPVDPLHFARAVADLVRDVN